jgi:hypothetical protein
MFLSIDESRDAKTLSLFIFLTRDLRSNLTISLREKAEIFVSRLNRKFVIMKKMFTNEQLRDAKKFEDEKNYEEK